MSRRKKLIERLERNQRIHESEIRAKRLSSAEFYEALEDGILPDGRTIEELEEPNFDIHGDSEG